MTGCCWDNKPKKGQLRKITLIIKIFKRKDFMRRYWAKWEENHKYRVDKWMSRWPPSARISIVPTEPNENNRVSNSHTYCSKKIQNLSTSIVYNNNVWIWKRLKKSIQRIYWIWFYSSLFQKITLAHLLNSIDFSQGIF